MPQVKEYTAPDRRLTLPAEGFAAFETAARRIGPAYNAAASDVRELGRLAAQSYKERLWPWDFIDLRGQRAGAGGGGTPGLKAEGFQSDPFGQFRSHGQTSRAAGVLGQMFNGAPTSGGGSGRGNSVQGSHGGKLIDGSGQEVYQNRTGNLIDTQGGGLRPLDPSKPNPYGQFGSVPWGTQVPPTSPYATSPPLDASGNPTARYSPDGYVSGPDETGHVDMYGNPAYDAAVKGSPQYVPVWTPADYGGGRDQTVIERLGDCIGSSFTEESGREGIR